MDFTLSLTHFCEVHGPKSVLCTQVQPLECATCVPSSPPQSQSLPSSPETQFDEPASDLTHATLQTSETGISVSSDFSGASTSVDPSQVDDVRFKRSNFSDAQGDMCASCSLAVPEDITRKLPLDAPGSFKADGKTTNGAPVLRSRAYVCLGPDQPEESQISTSHNSSDASFGSSASSDSCHDYILTYRTSRTPGDPDTFSALRASVIRTLSSELLPAGMSDGPLCFGDSNNGYTIAYVFRLLDPKARGRRRLYAFVALAGTDAARAFRACPLIWEAFSRMAKAIEAAAAAQEQKHKDVEDQDVLARGGRTYTPVSSFLSPRVVTHDGNPRKAGHTPARSLAEIVGNDRIFSDVHSQFVSLLHHLGVLYGGASLSETALVCQTMVHEDGLGRSQPQDVRVHRDVLNPGELDLLRDQDATPRPALVDGQGSLSNGKVKQCAPIPIDFPGTTQLVS